MPGKLDTLHILLFGGVPSREKQGWVRPKRKHPQPQRTPYDSKPPSPSHIRYPDTPGNMYEPDNEAKQPHSYTPAHPSSQTYNPPTRHPSNRHHPHSHGHRRTQIEEVSPPSPPPSPPSQPHPPYSRTSSLTSPRSRSSAAPRRPSANASRAQDVPSRHARHAPSAAPHVHSRTRPSAGTRSTGSIPGPGFGRHGDGGRRGGEGGDPYVDVRRGGNERGSRR